MTFSRWQACSLLGLILLTPVGRADAQPTISPLGFPAPNATGWNNSTVRVLFFCAPAQPFRRHGGSTTRGAIRWSPAR